MDKPSFKLVGAPCGQHGQYTFYKALRLTGRRERIVAIGDFFFVRIWQDSELVSIGKCGQHGQYTFYKALRLAGRRERIVAIGDFFFVRIWQESELVSIGELQLLWTDRVSDQTLVSLRLYFLPENTPDGRGQHGEDEVLAINDKVVVRAEDLLSWVSDGTGWRYGRRAVWRGACVPRDSCAAREPSAAAAAATPLHHARLDFGDVDREKSALEDADCPGVVVFSYPRYCRYRALAARLEGVQADWLRDSLVAALGGYAAPTSNTRILYCKDTFEYPELEGHEFVCNHLAPRLKGRPRGRRRRPPRSRSHTRSPSSRSSDSDGTPPGFQETKVRLFTPRRLSLRNGASDRQSDGDGDAEEAARTDQSPEDRSFLHQLRQFFKQRGEPFKMPHTVKDLSLRALYVGVCARGGYEAVCRGKLWRALHASRPARVRSHYERFLLPFENHERRNGSRTRLNGRVELHPKPIATIDVTDSPLRELPAPPAAPRNASPKILRTPSPKKFEEVKMENLDKEFISKPAEELNREFLESLPKEEKCKITVKPVEKLLENNVISERSNVVKLFEENDGLVSELTAKHDVKEELVLDEMESKKFCERSSMFLSELAQRLNLGAAQPPRVQETAAAQPQPAAPGALSSLATLGDKYAVNGHAPPATEQVPGSARPAGRSSLRAVRVKPARPAHAAHPAARTPPAPSPRPDSASRSPPTASSAPPVTNFGIHHPPVASTPTPTAAVNTATNSPSDDEIVEVPYKPKTPEIIDLDEYPESPQAVKKKKLEILKERGLEVTAIPPTWATVPAPVPLTPLINPPMMLNPAMQHQIMTQASLFQMYNIIPQNYANGIQPPKVIQATCIYGNSGPEKTVYGNPKDPFMPPPHMLHGAPVKPQRAVHDAAAPTRQDILDLTCKVSPPSQKPAVEIVRLPPAPSPKLTSSAQNLSAKNYTLIDGKAVVGSNLEITLVNPKVQTPPKNRPPQKRSSNGKFMSTKTPTPPKEYPKPYASPAPAPAAARKTPITIPNYQLSRDDASPTSSTGSRDSQSSLLQNNLLQNAFKGQNLAQMMDMQKSPVPMSPYIDPMYMSALYSSLAGQMDQRQLAMYRDYMASQFRGYSGLLGATPTTKN